MKSNSFLKHILFFSMLNMSIFTAHNSVATEELSKIVNEISISDISNIVTSVSKKPERAFEAAAAIFVITDDDIKRSGSTSIAEALRLAPGIQVNRVNSSNWAVSSRGFSNSYANKLLVLIDGRSVYTHTFSGVDWDIQDVVLEDIKRIEVIRGPGASIWGANAVNGVINIITKRSEETQGTLITGLAGTNPIGTEEVGRYGGKLGENTFYRVYAKRKDVGDTELTNGDPSHTEWNQTRTGFRVDSKRGEADSLTFQGDVYYSEKDRRTAPINGGIPVETFNVDHNSGGNILGRWNHQFTNNSETILQAYFDRSKRDHILLGQARNTFDLDFQHNLNIDPNNELIWGLGYRRMDSSFENSDNYTFTPTSRSDNLYSSFIQLKHYWIPDKVYTILGSKFEHNDFTGFEFQPNARIAWSPDPNNTIWASISRAVRTPSIAEDSIMLVDSNSPIPGGRNILVGDTSFDSEELIAYELGYRTKPTNKIDLDITTFINKYKKLRNLDSFTVDFPDVLIGVANKGKANAAGFEIAATYDVSNDFWIKGSYSFIDLDFDIDPITDPEQGKTARNMFNINTHYNITDNIQWDTMLYYTDDLPDINGLTANFKLDTRVAWKVNDGLELSIVGQNLLDESHREYNKQSNTLSPVEIQRAVYGKVTFRF